DSFLPYPLLQIKAFCLLKHGQSSRSAYPIGPVTGGNKAAFGTFHDFFGANYSTKRDAVAHRFGINHDVRYEVDSGVGSWITVTQPTRDFIDDQNDAFFPTRPDDMFYKWGVGIRRTHGFHDYSSHIIPQFFNSHIEGGDIVVDKW